MGRKRQFWESNMNNQRTFIMYYNRILSIALSRFRWINLPPSVDERFLELCLCGKGYACFFRDEVMGYLALECAIGGKLNVYRVPTYRRAYATNGYQNELNQNNSVLIFNNLTRTPSIPDIEHYAQILFDIDRTIAVNARAQKTPVLLSCKESQKLVVQNAYQQFDQNEQVIIADKDFDLNSIRVLKTDAPYVADKLTELKTQTWNECLTAFGISNVSYQKRERLISDEVTRSMGGTMANRFSFVEARKQACNMINSMFGTDIDVEFREDLNIIDDINILGGEEDT